MATRLSSVLVTGAEGALGGVVVERFAQAGVRVVAAHRGDPPAELKSRDGVEWLRLDLADRPAVEAALAARPLDGLVHCAGGFRYGALDQLAPADLDFLLDANLKSTVHLLRVLVPGMRKRGFGRVVLVSARATLAAPANMGMYAATKAAINSLVEAIAQETLDAGININAVLPSMIDTPANRRGMPQADFSKWVAPAALADIIFSLTQPWGDPIHGALIPVSGRL
jgi:NAD(P)-dependent dehydrogenase (short-subunit alcohol dehydrogenase family)